MIKSRVPLALEAQTYVSLLKTADILVQEVEQLLKRYGLTGAQYNVLRILRGAEPEGLACSAISEQLISHDPDMTRLLDRMEKRGLISRHREVRDRRVVKTRVTPQGLELLKGLDHPISDLHRRQFRRVSQRRLRELGEVLEELRESRK